MTTLSQTMKYAFLLSCFTTQTLSAMEHTATDHLSLKDKTDSDMIIRAILSRPLYPVDIMPDDPELRCFHLETFPSFVLVTESGFQKLQQDKPKEDEPTLMYSLDFLSNCDSTTYGHYSIGPRFFDRIRKAGIYQPDYISYNQETGGSYSLKKEITLTDSQLLNQLAKALHSVSLSNKTAFVQECNFDCSSHNLLFAASSNPSALKGQFVQKSVPFSKIKTQIIEMSNDLPYTPSVRGITYVLDSNSQLTKWTLTCHETTDDELETLTATGELKIPINGWPKA